MRYLPLVIGAVAAFAAGGASAQSINLTGNYRCIQDCRDGYLGGPAFITQNGDSLNLVTETGESYRRLFAGRAADSIRRWQNLGAGFRAATATARCRAQAPCRLSAIARHEPDHVGGMG
jgi:hypothetical protein